MLPGMLLHIAVRLLCRDIFFEIAPLSLCFRVALSVWLSRSQLPNSLTERFLIVSKKGILTAHKGGLGSIRGNPAICEFTETSSHFLLESCSRLGPGHILLQNSANPRTGVSFETSSHFLLLSLSLNSGVSLRTSSHFLLESCSRLGPVHILLQNLALAQEFLTFYTGIYLPYMFCWNRALA